MPPPHEINEPTIPSTPFQPIPKSSTTPSPCEFSNESQTSTNSSPHVSPSISTHSKRIYKSPNRLIETIEGRKMKLKKKPWMYTISDSFSEHSILEEEPLSYEDALYNLHSNDWQATINSDFQSLIKNNTWEILPQPPICIYVGCKWILKIKYGPNNTILKSKACLVVQGFSQKEGIDYYETFSPVLKSSSMQVKLAFAANHGLDIHQMDVITAFLNGF